ncbi:MAG: hotdog fold thioesterase [Gemmatimonadaceae bacterium]|nr:hotdog fold thioesterase [Gemmatimonadaceae bacterium]
MTPEPATTPEQRRAQAIVREMMARDAFSQWLGIEVLHVAPGTAAIRMTVRPEMVNGFGRTHGGITYSFADSAFAFAANGHGRVSVSIDSQIAHTQEVRVGDVLEAIATEEQVTERLGFYRVQVTCRGTPVALFRGTVYRTRDEHPDASTSPSP